MTKRILVDVHEKFHADIKAAAAIRKKTIKQLLLEILAEWLIRNKPRR
jgi:hypothetical protein